MLFAFPDASDQHLPIYWHLSGQSVLEAESSVRLLNEKYGGRAETARITVKYGRTAPKISLIF